jgi:hypothetical protein
LRGGFRSISMAGPGSLLPAVGLGFATLVAGCAGPGGPAPEPGPFQPGVDRGLRPLPPIRLRSQWGREIDLGALRGRTALLVLGDRGSTEACKGWDRAFASALPDYDPHLRIMDLRGIPGLFRGIALSRIRDQMEPPETDLYVDWKGVVAEQYDSVAGVPNVLVIGPDGEILVHEIGAAGPEAVERVRLAVGCGG